MPRGKKIPAQILPDLLLSLWLLQSVGDDDFLMVGFQLHFLSSRQAAAFLMVVPRIEEEEEEEEEDAITQLQPKQ